VLQPHAVVPLLLGTWRPSLSVDVFSTNLDNMLHTHTHPFNGPFSGTTQVSRYQNLDFTEARDSEWQWLGSASLHLAPDRQPHQHTTTLFFTGRMPFLPSNQQRQSTEGTTCCSCGQMVEQTDGPTVTRFMHPVRHTVQAVSTIWVTID